MDAMLAVRRDQQIIPRLELNFNTTFKIQGSSSPCKKYPLSLGLIIPEARGTGLPS